MTKRDDDSSKLWIGALLGAAAVGTLSVLLATREHNKDKHQTLGLVGKALENVGCILEKHDIKEPKMMKQMEKTIEKHDCQLSGIINWVATGFQIWKKIKG